MPCLCRNSMLFTAHYYNGRYIWEISSQIVPDSQHDLEDSKSIPAKDEVTVKLNCEADVYLYVGK